MISYTLLPNTVDYMVCRNIMLSRLTSGTCLSEVMQWSFSNWGKETAYFWCAFCVFEKSLKQLWEDYFIYLCPYYTHFYSIVKLRSDHVPSQWSHARHIELIILLQNCNVCNICINLVSCKQMGVCSHFTQ